MSDEQPHTVETPTIETIIIIATFENIIFSFLKLCGRLLGIPALLASAEALTPAWLTVGPVKHVTLLLLSFLYYCLGSETSFLPFDDAKLRLSVCAHNIFARNLHETSF